MQERDRIAARMRSSMGLATTGGAASLPWDLLEESCRRVRIASLVVGGLWAFAVLMNDIVYRAVGAEELWHASWVEVGRPTAIVGLALSLAMVVAARRWSGRPRLVIHLGLVYEVLTAFMISFVMWWKPMMHGGRVSWVCVLILLYPSIAPTTLRKTLLASLAAASMEVVNWAIAAGRGVLPPDATTISLAWTLSTPYVCAFMAIIPMQVIRRLGGQVARARELGSYLLEERIGRGGMGEVYRASHRLLARPAAIKVIRPEVVGGSADAALAVAGRFRREADAAASLRSPHTIELYDFGVSDDGALFYVMELLDGVDLETLVDRFGPLPVERAVHVLRQDCESLAEAHARGLVHRDIKPSNIFVCRLGLAVDFVKVLDFGLVKREHRDGRETLKLSSPDVTSGTPAFMAPEMATDQSNADRRVDIYALGCVAYWLVTGRLVFEGDSAVQLLLKHVQAQPTPPSQHAKLPAEFDALVLACLAKRPEDRPADAAALARRLSEVPLREEWTEALAQAWWETNRPESKAARAGAGAHDTATIAHARLTGRGS